MEDNILEASGVVQEVSEKNGRHSFKMNEKTYSFFETKQNGDPTKAWSRWQELSVKSGDTILILYKDNQSGKYTYHNVLDIKKPTEQEAKKIVEKKDDDKPDWDAIAEGKVRHGVVCSMIEAGKDYKEIEKETPRFVELIMNKKSDTPAAKKMKQGIKKQQEGEDEINIDDIPF